MKNDDGEVFILLLLKKTRAGANQKPPTDVIRGIRGEKGRYKIK